ncbi:MAG TPA: sulfatase [Planctomycetaceae bacterium]|nr:sulfatase [Planctomycetaceae bacterium]
MRRLSALLVLFCFPVLGPAAEQPNFVVILCDDLGYGDLACFGHPHIETPNLDKLASQGVKLTDCYSAAPVCSSSRAGLLCGKTPNRLGVYDWIPAGHVVHLRKQDTTIATFLKNAGYETAHVGKWHCNGKFNSPEQPQPGDHGFNHWFSTQNNAAPRHENPNNFVRNGEKVGPLEGFACQLVADEGIDWLKHKRDKTKPFFLFTCFHEPHEPVESPADLVAKYEPVAKTRDEAQYFANVENIDLAVGKLMTALDEQKLAENTLVFFTSDNGPETLDRYRGANRSYGSPGKMRAMKLHIYEGGIRVPGIARWPGKIEAGTVSDIPVAGFDLLPTFSELAEVAIPETLDPDGTSLVPLLKDQKLVRSRPMFWHYYRSLSVPCAALRDGDWKIVARWDAPHIYTARHPQGNNVTAWTQAQIKTAKLVEFELYNLRTDPSESNDLASSQPEILSKLRSAIVTRYAQMQQESPEWEFPSAPPTLK